jgi:hypothetical protein
MLQKIAAAEDNLVELDQLRLASTGALVSGATVTAALYQADGVTAVVTGVSMPATAVVGRYQGTLLAASLAALVPGQFYILQVAATGPVTCLRRLKLLAGYHREMP